MAVAMGSPKTNLELWCEALNAKYHNKGEKKWGMCIAPQDLSLLVT